MQRLGFFSLRVAAMVSAVVATIGAITGCRDLHVHVAGTYECGETTKQGARDRVRDIIGDLSDAVDDESVHDEDGQADDSGHPVDDGQ